MGTFKYLYIYTYTARNTIFSSSKHVVVLNVPGALSVSSHPYTMRAKILNPALNAEMKYNSDEARKARERKQENQKVVLCAREKF